MIVLVVLAQLADAATFPLALTRPGIEVNPIASTLMGLGGVGLVLAVKTVGIGLIVLIAAAIPHRRRILALAAWVGIIGALSNLSAGL